MIAFSLPSDIFTSKGPACRLLLVDAFLSDIILIMIDFSEIHRVQLRGAVQELYVG